jgi:deoxyribodipyrimidine photo-lyase
MWFRRDLRLRDNAALARAAQSDDVLGLFVLDPALLARAGAARLGWLASSLRSLSESMAGNLLVVRGAPAEVVPAVAAQVGAATVHIAADHGPYGRRRDATTANLLTADGRALMATGSSYAVAPGRVRKADGTGYKVFTPYFRGWTVHGWRAPADSTQVRWCRPHSLSGAPWPSADAAELHGDGRNWAAGEEAAVARWQEFRATSLRHYNKDRDRPDLDGTSRLSSHLRWGEIHPRTLLADLDDSPGSLAFRRQLAFRDFYADLLARNPSTATSSMNPDFDPAVMYRSGPDAGADYERWCHGETGFPFVDAGMRQLRRTGWMHNRVRMVVASFLVKDLLIPWWRGADWFMGNLTDADLANNSQGWQWVAGCGTDAAPYFRIFNPVTQGRRFDPAGDYIRTYVPELSHLANSDVHEPWLLPTPPPGYPAPMVDHQLARAEALARYAALRSAT